MTDKIYLPYLVLRGEVDSNEVCIADMLRTQAIDHLRQYIWKTDQDLHDIAQKALALWKLKEPIDTTTVNFADKVGECLHNLSNCATLLLPTSNISMMFPTPVSIDHLYILVELRAVSWPTGDRSGIGSKRTLDRDITADIHENWSKKLKTGLPPVDQLANMLDNDLDAGTKVPLRQREFDSLISTFMADPCTSDHVGMVFRVSETDSTPYSVLFRCALLTPTPPSDGTEGSFISFWDFNIGRIIEMLIREGRIIRNNKEDPDNGPKRPDFGFIINGACLFRGEETAATNLGSTNLELIDWGYPRAECIFGYNASGPDITLVAVCRPSDESKNPKVLNIGSANLQYRIDRIINLRRLINLSYHISDVASRIAEDGIPEFLPIRGDDKTIEKVGNGIVKTFRGAAGKMRVAHLQTVYQLMKEKGVPNVDRLEVSNPDSRVGPNVYLEPRGIDRRPRDATEVIQAVSCVLEALEVMHSGPKQLFHRDIRWPNIVMLRDDPTKWMLIDFDDAVSPPTHAANHLGSEWHSPRVSEDNHRGEVDIWAVGQLLLESSGFASGISRRMTEIGKQMKKEEEMTAAVALALVASLP